MPLLLLLLAVPTAEIFIFIEVGGILGTWPTIGIIVGTAVVGGLILRWQGVRTLARARQQLAANRLPVAELAEGAMLAFAAVLLLTPGFMTDAIGTLLLVPIFRRRLIRALVTRFAGGMAPGADQDGRQDAPRGGPVIEGEFTRIDEENDEQSRRDPDRRRR